jgi:outer membrane cobalamin receptor
MRLSWLLFSLPVFAAGLNESALAQEQAGLDEVLVTAKRLEETLPEVIAKFGTRVDTITREEVQNGSYSDTAQSLQALAPGLYLLPKNGPFDYADISLLGSRTDDVLWLIDGVRINNRLYSGTPPLDTVSAGIVEKYEVLEGGQALFYGTAAVAGAVNIVTKSFSDEPRAGVNVTADTNDGQHVDGYFSDGLGANHFVVYGSSDKSDGYRSFRKEDYQPSATERDRGYDVKTAGLKYGFNFSDDLRLSATYQHTDADVDNALPFRVARNVNKRQEDLATAKLDYALNEDVGFYLKGYYHKWHTDIDTTYNDLITPGQQDVLYDDAFWGYDDRGINALSKFKLSEGIEAYVGYDLQRYGGRDEVLVIEQHKEQTQAVFAQIHLSPEAIPNTHLSAGLRYNHPDAGQDATVFTVTGQYDFSDALFFRTTLGTNFRLPTAEELFANDPFYERGNPDLKPERSKSINASVGGRFGSDATSLKWELIGFAREVKDLIDYEEFDEITQQDVFGNVPGTVKVRGFEATLEGSWSNAFSSTLSFTHNRSHNDDGEQIARIPEQLAKASLDYHPAALPIGATLAVSHTGDVAAPIGDDLLEYGNFTVVDISARYFLDTARRHRLNLSLQNALDEDYGRPSRGCADNTTDGPFQCSSPYIYQNLGLPRTLRASYSYAF